jgi:putative membrane protein
MKLITKLLINILALFVVSYLIPGFIFDGILSMTVTSIVMGAVNTFIRPVIQILFLPLSIVTVGITAFLINVLLLWGISYIVPGFEISNFWTAVLASIVLTLVSMFLNRLAKDKKE